MMIRSEGLLLRLWQTILALFMILVVASIGHAEATGARAGLAELRQAVKEAAHEVDQAWEVFHEAALGGLLASPVDQAEIERSLHESRTLLLRLREALDRNDRAEWEKIRSLLTRLHALTDEAIHLSQKRKP